MYRRYDEYCGDHNLYETLLSTGNGLFFVDISVKAVVDRDDKHVAVNSKADRNASVAGQGVVCCGIGIFQKIAEQRGKLRIGETGGWNRCGRNVHPDLIS